LFSKLLRKISVALADSPPARAFLICAANVFKAIFIVNKLHTVADFLIAMITSVLFRIFSGALVTLFQFLKNEFLFGRGWKFRKRHGYLLSGFLKLEKSSSFKNCQFLTLAGFVTN
jgi:hypothetical protein